MKSVLLETVNNIRMFHEENSLFYFTHCAFHNELCKFTYALIQRGLVLLNVINYIKHEKYIFTSRKTHTFAKLTSQNKF